MKLAFKTASIVITVALWYSAIATHSEKVAITAVMSTLIAITIMLEKDEDE